MMRVMQRSQMMITVSGKTMATAVMIVTNIASWCRRLML